MLIFKILNGFINYPVILKLFKFYKSKNILKLIFCYIHNDSIPIHSIFFFICVIVLTNCTYLQMLIVKMLIF